ncbi:choline monooxygenase, chloroplastic isoform X1 [Lycium barbarum]|uniref:choline monooxygenase, chloroplastic isoform X1 n=1 Tax=Lycium barbarum TaxID=112863 RepID=UPI00293E560D|nr:choline monooxygenase, chloroplastic isoform X1 [Lycium barbarum]
MALLQQLSSFHQFKKPKLCCPLTPLKNQIFTYFIKPRKHLSSFQVSSSLDYSNNHNYTKKLVQEFDPNIPIEEAVTPPSSWYTDTSFYTHELNQVFFKGWQVVGYSEQIKEPSQYFTGRLGNVEYVVCRDDGGKIYAFHNVCRHHATLLASGSGKSSCFVCPYHGWTYGLDGALLKATRITGIKNFKVNEMGLVPMRVAVWGPFILLNFENGALSEQESDFDLVGNEWLGSSSQILADGGVDSSLSFLCRREYTVECNWKVFCDNYLDGGYHVPYAHKDLASGLTLDSYSTTILEKVSIQRCETGSAERDDQEFDRLGSKALYAFVYPNFMINRYGPWMDTNLVLPQGPRKCLVIFDYFLDASLKGDESFIAQSLQDSETVQIEDIKLCEAVQRGLESPAYRTGRYAPQVEKAMHHFHSLLYENLHN